MLVLITDGASNGGELEPLTAARLLAAEEQVRIYTIGIGADPEAAGVRSPFGLNPGLELDEASLMQIAEITGGLYFRARDSAELGEIGQALDALEPVAQQPTRVPDPRALPLAAGRSPAAEPAAGGGRAWPGALQRLRRSHGGTP